MKNFAIATILFLVMGCSTDNVLSTEAQLKKDVALIDKYLEKNGIVPIKDPSGLRLVIENPGSLPFPDAGSKLTVYYTGKYLSNGDIFDQSTLTPSGSPKPFATPLSNLIPGWQYGFAYLGKGGKATFYVPSGLAYGHRGSPPIPPDANLIFEVELFGFTN